MTSSRQTGEPAKGGREQDTFSRLYRHWCCAFGRPGQARDGKRSFNRRVRRQTIDMADVFVDMGADDDC